MSVEKSFDALDRYNSGWLKGDSAVIYRELADTYTFSGLPNVETVDKRGFKMFWVNFRSTVEDEGGPKAVSSRFMVLKCAVRKEVCRGVNIANF